MKERSVIFAKTNRPDLEMFCTFRNDAGKGHQPGVYGAAGAVHPETPDRREHVSDGAHVHWQPCRFWYEQGIFFQTIQCQIDFSFGPFKMLTFKRKRRGQNKAVWFVFFQKRDATSCVSVRSRSVSATCWVLPLEMSCRTQSWNYWRTSPRVVSAWCVTMIKNVSWCCGKLVRHRLDDKEVLFFAITTRVDNVDVFHARHLSMRIEGFAGF